MKSRSFRPIRKAKRKKVNLSFSWIQPNYIHSQKYNFHVIVLVEKTTRFYYQKRWNSFQEYSSICIFPSLRFLLHKKLQLNILYFLRIVSHFIDLLHLFQKPTIVCRYLQYFLKLDQIRSIFTGNVVSFFLKNCYGYCCHLSFTIWLQK